MTEVVYDMASVLRAVNRWVHAAMLFLAELSLGFMVILVIVTVVLRYFFSSGIAWAEEVIPLLVGYFAFFACAMGVRDKLHISMDIFYNLAPKGGIVRAAMGFFSDLCVLLSGLFMLYYGGERIVKLMAFSGTLSITHWPNWVQYAAVPVVGFIILFDSLLYLTRVLKPGDRLFSEPEPDYASQVMHEKKEGGAE
jgi:TRAP-type C4-dicarboxylate transport system permease small subunit